MPNALKSVFPLSVQLNKLATTPQIRIRSNRVMAVTATPSWLPEQTYYPMSLFAYKPLVNGEETFAALEEALQKAQKSIDIITWGFQASMYLRRAPNANESTLPCFGQLLEACANRGVKVRVLVWYDHVGKFVEKSCPGWGERTDSHFTA